MPLAGGEPLCFRCELVYAAPSRCFPHSRVFVRPLSRARARVPLARKPNYDFEKHRRELDRKAAKDEKLRKKRERSANQREQSDVTEQTPSESSNVSPE